MIAKKRAVEVEREKAIEEALATVLLATDDEQRAADRRTDTITAAESVYAKTIAEIDLRRAAALRRMKALDESVASLAEMTGLSRSRITELTRLAADDDSPTRRRRSRKEGSAPHVPGVVVLDGQAS